MGIANTLAMIRTLKSFVADESAVTAIEYALIAGIVSVVIVPVVTIIGGTLKGIFLALSVALQ
jgi:pilus assembly protein Flp/PilA